MTHFENLSAEAEKTIYNLYNKLRAKSLFNDIDKQVMVSLYALMPSADEKVLGILNEYLVTLPDLLSNEEIACLQKEYNAVISYSYHRADLNPGGIVHAREGMLHLPTSVVELCMEMAGDTKNKSIYLPFTGDGSFASQCHDATIKGFELDRKCWAISQIIASASTSSTEIKLLSSSEEPFAFQEDTDKFDYVFSFPPMLNKRDGRKVIDCFYRIITEQLKENGELYAVLPLGFCSESSGWFDVKKTLLDYPGQYSILVVSLPPVLVPVATVPICLVNIVRDGRGLIGLADVSGYEFLSSHDIAGTHVFDMNVQSILETIKKQDEKHVWVGTAKDLNSSLDLTPTRYLLEQNMPEVYEVYKTVRIGDLIEIMPLGRNPQTASDTPLLGMKELSFKYLNCDIAYGTVPVKPEHYSRFLDSDALLTGFMGGKFKVGRIKGLHSGKGVSLRSEVHAFRIISKDITEDFLLRSILSEFAERQAKSLSSGVNITRISKEDFLNIRIALPSIEEQEAICKEDTKSSISESERKVIETFEEFREDMHMKKHAIGQTVFNLNNWWKALQKARKEGNGVVCDSASVGKNQTITVGEIYYSLQETINQLQQQITKFDRGNGLEIKNFALTEFIEAYIERKRSPLFEFKYDSVPHHSNTELRDFSFDEETAIVSGGDQIILDAGAPIEYVEFAPEALTIILDNIVSNACSHGFEGREEGLNIIKIDLFTEGDQCIVSVSNNGEPLHAQISTKDVFTYSRTSKNGKGHFGIGGYEVKKLMKEFGGDAEFVSEPESDFPVTYRLVFNNTNIKSFEL